eukprot:7146413-Pyramimonas_sp.AAC.1
MPRRPGAATRRHHTTTAPPCRHAGGCVLCPGPLPGLRVGPQAGHREGRDWGVPDRGGSPLREDE